MGGRRESRYSAMALPQQDKGCLQATCPGGQHVPVTRQPAPHAIPAAHLQPHLEATAPPTAAWTLSPPLPPGPPRQARAPWGHKLPGGWQDGMILPHEVTHPSSGSHFSTHGGRKMAPQPPKCQLQKKNHLGLFIYSSHRS